jgi:four helix bundle protein
MLRGYRDLKVYQLAFELAIGIFEITNSFPKDECYSLTDQIRRSSRSVAANNAENYRRRQYLNMFVSKIADADAEATETQVWLDFALNCRYLPNDEYTGLTTRYTEIGKMLSSMMAHPERFALPSRTQN